MLEEHGLPGRGEGPTGVKLSEERREILVTGIQQLFADEFERDLSEFQTRRLIDFLLHQVGPPVYNQAIQDARGYMISKLEDLDGEVYAPEAPV